jgi:hypothetical protein
MSSSPGSRPALLLDRSADLTQVLPEPERRLPRSAGQELVEAELLTERRPGDHSVRLRPLDVLNPIRGVEDLGRPGQRQEQRPVIVREGGVLSREDVLAEMGGAERVGHPVVEPPVRPPLSTA